MDKDRSALEAGRPAMSKLMILKDVKSAMKKKDMISILMDHDIFGVIKEFIAPIDNQVACRCAPCDVH